MALTRPATGRSQPEGGAWLLAASTDDVRTRQTKRPDGSSPPGRAAPWMRREALPKEPLHKAHCVILSAAKNPGILHCAGFVQNDNLTCAKLP